MHVTICSTCGKSNCNGWCPNATIKAGGHTFTVREIWPDIETMGALGDAVRRATDEELMRLCLESR